MTNVSKGDRPWNDPGPKGGNSNSAVEEAAQEAKKPLLRAVVMDFSAVANLDTTGVQNLVDARKEVEKWADKPVEFHFSGILSPWIRRALIAAGFGQGAARHGTALEVAPVVPQDDSLSPADRARVEEERLQQANNGEGSSSGENSTRTSSYEEKLDSSRNSFVAGELEGGLGSSVSLPLLDRATPFFHFDLADALNAVQHGSRS